MIGQFLLGILLLLSGVYIFKLCEEKENLKRRLVRYESIISQEEYQQELDDKVTTQHSQVVYLEEQYKTFLRKVNEIKKELGSYEENLELQSFGFYEPKYNFICSEDYISQLKSLKLQQKQMISGDFAVECSTGWVVGESKKEGDKLVKNFKKLILTIFNTECDEIIQKVKPGKVEISQSKIENKFKSLNKSATVIRCNIVDDYLILKTRELHLQYELECKRQEEKEVAQQALEDKKIRTIIEKAEKEKEAADERARECQREIDIIREQLASTYQKEMNVAEQENERLENQVNKLLKALKQAQTDGEAAENRSRMVKAGYIFVMSNIGSFGNDLYRISLTTVDEYSYTSVMNRMVPFPFDIHLQFFSEDGRETLRLLHDKFQGRRVNRVNLRRDFFQVSFDEIKKAIEDIRKDTGSLKNFMIEERVPNAYEYRKTQQQQKQQQQEKLIVNDEAA